MLTPEVAIDLPEWIPSEDPSSYTSRTSGKTCVPGSSREYDFSKMNELGDEFLMLRNYPSDMYKLDGEGLKLKAGRDDIKAVASPSFIAIRQQHHYFTSSAVFDSSSLAAGECAGLVLIQNNLYNLRAEVCDGVLRAVICKDGIDEILGETPASGEVEVSIEVAGLIAKVFLGDKQVGEAKVSDLSTEVAGGFVGCCVGVYASACGKDSSTYVNFKKFSYKH